MMTKQRILELIAARPDLTEVEISEHLFGSDGYQQHVNSACGELVQALWLERQGTGGHGDPFRYRRRRILHAV